MNSSTLLRLDGLQPPPAHIPWTSSPWMIRNCSSIPHFLQKKTIAVVHAEPRGFGVTLSDTKTGKGGGDVDSGRRPTKGKNIEGGGGDKDKDDDDEIPQVVFDRMIRRVVFSVGVPMATGVVLLYVLGLIKERGLWDVPMWLPFVTTLVLFGTSALGIAYGTLSTSWDPNREGSMLGWSEARQNWPELWKEDEQDRQR